MPKLLVTGFGPFLSVRSNPSRELARRLAARPAAPWATRALELPVSLEQAGPTIDRALDQWDEPIDFLLGLGVQRGPYLRVETRARLWLSARKPDNDGRFPSQFVPSVDGPPALFTSLDAVPLVAALARRGGPWTRVSSDAGGYVCERAYYHLLLCARERGAKALFVHVAPERDLPLALQERALRDLLGEAARLWACDQSAKGASPAKSAATHGRAEGH